MSLHESNFQKWLVDHMPEDKMLYKKQFSDYMVFWRDRIIEKFYPTYDRNYNDEVLIRDHNKNVEIIGTHMSKSILHPVVRIKYKGVEIVFRYNFYDYDIAIIGDIPLDIPMNGLFGSLSFTHYFNVGCEGFPEEYKLKSYYETNKCKFMACLFDHYQFYTFMFLLKNEIDKKAGL